MSKIYTAIISVTLDAIDDEDAITTCKEIEINLNQSRGGNMDIGASCVAVQNDKGEIIKYGI